MNKLRIHIIILISVGLLIGCSASNLEVTSTIQQATTLQGPTEDEAKEALIALVKSNPNVFPNFVFNNPEDQGTLDIYL